MELNLSKRFKNKFDKDLDFLTSNYDIEKIILFGSCARGTYKVTSDLDLLVLTKEDLTRQERGEIHSTLDEPLDKVSTDVVLYKVEDFLNSNSKIG